MASSFPAQAPAAKRAKYDAKDLAAKVQILKALQTGGSRKEVMEKFQVKKSTLSSYVKNEDQIMQAYDGDIGEEQDGRYINIMPADVPLREYFAIDNDVAVAGIVTDSDIVAEVMDGEGTPTRTPTIQTSVHAPQ
ncbi:hypothetical protein HPB49_025751 [Dermacentor silvarum]|nr:hypothetical protein HPB49_025751 [Dermacentor silvarum]